jgi:hypothetical protein
LAKLLMAFVSLLFMLGVHHLCANDGCFPPRLVEVKQKASNAIGAKQKALASAFRFAFLELLKDQLGIEAGDAENISRKVSNDQLSDCVYDYSVEHEKYSDSFYIAELSCRFSKKNIAILLESFEKRAEDTVEEGSFRRSDGLGEITKPIPIVVLFDDFICNFKRLHELGCRITMFSPQVVAFVLDGCSLDEFRELSLKYANIK